MAPDADGLIGHAGAALLRKLADQCGLTSEPGAALGRRGEFPLIDRGMALVSMAVPIALGAVSMSDVTVLAHQELVLGAAPSDAAVRRMLELADPATLPGAGCRQACTTATTLRTPSQTRCAIGCWACPPGWSDHARASVLKISRTWPWKDAFLTCWQRLCALPAPA